MKLTTLLLLAAAASLHAQGSLTPPGAPAPMMKTLDQLEPRTPVNATTTPGDATHLFVISQPGSYYLTGNLTGAAAKSGILIAASDVTLDLNGFAVIGVPGSINGIKPGDSVSRHRITLRNGTITGWPGYGIAGAGLGNSYERLRVIGNGGGGAAVSYFEGGLYSSNGNVSSCVFSHNVGHGMDISSHSVVSRTIANSNTSPYVNGALGFRLTGGNVVSDCITAGNTEEGLRSNSGTITNCVSAGNDVGIGTSTQCVIRDSAVWQNSTQGIKAGEAVHVTGCTVVCPANSGAEVAIAAGAGSVFEDSTAIGGTTGAIRSGDNCTISRCLMGACNGYSTFGATPNGLTGGAKNIITDCSSAGNEDAGILAGSGSVITGCHVSANGTGGAAAGIQTTGTGSRIADNKTRDNTGTGILCSGGSGADTIINNVSGGNTANYSPASGTTFGPVQTPAAGVSPKANF